MATKKPELKKAVGVLKELSADERTRMLAEDREKARRDITSRLDGARKEGIQIGEERGEEKSRENERKFVLELLAQGLSADEIKQRLIADEK